MHVVIEFDIKKVFGAIETWHFGFVAMTYWQIGFSQILFKHVHNQKKSCLFWGEGISV